MLTVIFKLLFMQSPVWDRNCYQKKKKIKCHTLGYCLFSLSLDMQASRATNTQTWMAALPFTESECSLKQQFLIKEIIGLYYVLVVQFYTSKKNNNSFLTSRNQSGDSFSLVLFLLNLAMTCIRLAHCISLSLVSFIIYESPPSCTLFPEFFFISQY